jgi:hypothetical protein
MIEWNTCKPIGSDPIVYQVQLSRLRDQEYKQVSAKLVLHSVNITH